jgi:hypothetical protein
MADMHLIVRADFDTCQLFAIGPIIGEPHASLTMTNADLKPKFVHDIGNHRAEDLALGDRNSSSRFLQTYMLLFASKFIDRRLSLE